MLFVFCCEYEIQVEQDVLFELILVANFLDIKVIIVIIIVIIVIIITSQVQVSTLRSFSQSRSSSHWLFHQGLLNLTCKGLAKKIIGGRNVDCWCKDLIPQIRKVSGGVEGHVQLERDDRNLGRGGLLSFFWIIHPFKFPGVGSAFSTFFWPRIGLECRDPVLKIWCHDTADPCFSVHDQIHWFPWVCLGWKSYAVTAGRALPKKCLSPQVSPQITQLVIILVSIALLVTSSLWKVKVVNWDSEQRQKS